MTHAPVASKPLDNSRGGSQTRSCPVKSATTTERKGVRELRKKTTKKLPGKSESGAKHRIDAAWPKARMLFCDDRTRRHHLIAIFLDIPELATEERRQATPRAERLQYAAALQILGGNHFRLEFWSQFGMWPF